MSLSPSVNPFEVQRLNGPADYLPDWDVPSLNKEVSDWLEKEIVRLKGKATPDPAFKIPALVAPPGLGKTHLFGRITHQMQGEALVVFVPQIENPDRPEDHIRFHVVETLFRAMPGQMSPLDRILARLCQPSFVRYFEILPPSLFARHQSIYHRLQKEPDSVLDIIRRVQDVGPFQKLAHSVALQYPGIRQEVVRGLILAWSPEAALARYWLRGDSIPEEDQERLGLVSEPPSANEILAAVSQILIRQNKLLIVFCDQIEGVLAYPAEPVFKLTNALTSFAQSIPNLLVCMSCLEDKWEEVQLHAPASFKDRVERQLLRSLQKEQGVELVRRRLAGWPKKEVDPDGTWPFRAVELAQFVQKNPVSPRGLIKTCSEFLKQWSENDQADWIALLEVKETPPLPSLFLAEWDREMAAIRANPTRHPIELQEDRLHRAVSEALELARDAQFLFDGVRIAELRPTPITWARHSRPALSVLLDNGTKSLVAVTKIDNAREFVGYFNAITQMVSSMQGTVFIHPKEAIKLGAVTQAKFDAARKEGKLRTLSLTEDQETAVRLECFLTVLDKARSKELQLGAHFISDKDCVDQAIRTSVMANLGLYDKVCSGWSQPQGSAVEPPTKAHAQAANQGGKSSKVAVVAPPPVSQRSDKSDGVPDSSWPQKCLQLLVEKLRIWDLKVLPIGVEVGPTFARLKVQPQGKTTVAKLRNKAEDLKIHIGLGNWPLIDSQANHVSVDVQMPERRTVAFQESMEGLPTPVNSDASVPLGLDVGGKAHWLNLANTSDCHLLIAGTTGSGKSELLKVMVAGLAQRLGPDQVRFLFIDPKRVTFNFSGESPYFLHPVVHDCEEAIKRIEECFDETERRYQDLEKNRCENIVRLKNAPPRWVVVIDEFADLMADTDAKKVLGTPLKRIAAKARAAGIHLVLATQRPEASVVTPLLRSNLPGRVSLKVASEADSKLILGTKDAFHLLGKGDLLWQHGAGLVRLQCPLVLGEELIQALRIH
jgi:DNA segregation ATPase FtsK/SpoIIIE-like protein